ncbi:MAG: hypothetical protein WCI67_20005 [Chloroflexales bacterium]
MKAPRWQCKAFQLSVFSFQLSPRWIMRENLTKARLARVDAAWVQRWQQQLR